MTRLEKIKDMNKEQMAVLLCGLSTCVNCVASETCRTMNVGFLDWLDEEVYDDDER